MSTKIVPQGKIKNYWGMNREAALQIGMKHVPREGEVWISDKLPKSRRNSVIAHEKIESYMIREKGLNYKQAHKVANKFEKNIAG